MGNSPTNFTDPLGLARQAVTAGVSLDSGFAGATPLPIHGDGGSFTNISSTCPNFGSCHKTQGDGAPTTAEDRAVLGDYAEKMGMATLTVATIPVTGTLAVAATSSRVIGWSVNALNTARNVRNTAVVLSNELMVTTLPVVSNPAVQQKIIDYSEGFFTSGPPPQSPAGVGGFFTSNVIDFLTQ